MNTCKRYAVDRGSADPFQAIVNAYLSKNAESEERYLRYYIVQRTLTDAVEKAAMAELPGGGRFSHQWRIPHSVLEKAKDALLKVDFQGVRSFDELHSLVARTIGCISGIGRLTIYDTAHRIGAYMALRPEFIYLHAGVRAGARALGLGHGAAKIPLSALPEAFQRLKPEQAEDCLCIYKDELKKLNNDPTAAHQHPHRIEYQ